MKVGFIGLGRMGQGMAGRILAAGHDLLVSDPMPGQTASLEEKGAVAVDSPAAATTSTARRSPAPARLRPAWAPCRSTPAPFILQKSR